MTAFNNTSPLAPFSIVNHLLHQGGQRVNDRHTPNRGGILVPRLLIMHYTAATQAAGSVNWFLSTKAKASAHLLIDRDGSITQFAPFNVITWHAGKSAWKGLTGLNKCSIGIELVNGGRLKRVGDKWICPVDRKTVPDEDVFIGRHKNGGPEHGWQSYTDKQMEVTAAVAKLLVQTYQLDAVLGHEDISPGRKVDPGPAFEWKMPLYGFP